MSWCGGLALRADPQPRWRADRNPVGAGGGVGCPAVVLVVVRWVVGVVCRMVPGVPGVAAGAVRWAPAGPRGPPYPCRLRRGLEPLVCKGFEGSVWCVSAPRAARAPPGVFNSARRCRGVWQERGPLSWPTCRGLAPVAPQTHRLLLFVEQTLSPLLVCQPRVCHIGDYPPLHGVARKRRHRSDHRAKETNPSPPGGTGLSSLSTHVQPRADTMPAPPSVPDVPPHPA